MAAALYLHNALFASEPSPPPVIARRPSYGRVPHDRHLSSVSSMTLRTSTSEHSHPTEPLLHSPYSDSAYHELLARQPGHPDRPASAWETALSLDSEPASQREQRRTWELELRKSLRRLRWLRRSLLVLIGVWAVYNTVRYFVASTIYTAHNRQLILLILGSVAGLSAVLVLLSFTLSALSMRIGWDLGPHSIYAIIQSLLGYCSSILLLGPAVVNFVLVFLWKYPSNDTNSVQGRCNWDIDVVWSGTGSKCASAHATPWSLWVVGSSIRLALTLAVVGAYHLVTLRYADKRQPFRRRHGRNHLHSISYPSMTESASDSRSSRAMVAASHSPVSVSRTDRQNSTSTADSESTLVTEGQTADHQAGRGARARISSSQSRDSRPVVIPGQTYVSPRSTHSTSLRFADEGRNETPNSSDDEDSEHRYGRQIRNPSRTYSLVHPDLSTPPTTVPRKSTDSTILQSDDARQAHEFNSFMGRFHSLIDQVNRETDAGIELAQNDQPEYYHYYSESTPPSPASTRLPSFDEQNDVGEFFPYFGRIIQRMPTIESMGSREVMSLASSARGDRSVHTLSRPPTRSNTLMTDGSQSPSRRNSLNAAVALSTPIEGSFNLDGFVSEMGELGRASSQRSTKTQGLGSKSTASYYTANSSGSPNDPPGESSYPASNPLRNAAR